MKPYYEHAGVTIYHGDCRDILPMLDPVGSIITDPVWPNTSVLLAGADHPYELLAQALGVSPAATRLGIHLGCDSDPRFLNLFQEGTPSSA